MREIGHVLAQLKLDKTDLNYSEMGQVFHKMYFFILLRNFIDLDETEQMGSRRNHLSEIWQMLQGDVYEKVHLNSLVKVVFSLLGCHDCLIIDAHLKAALPD